MPYLRFDLLDSAFIRLLTTHWSEECENEDDDNAETCFIHGWVCVRLGEISVVVR